MHLLGDIGGTKTRLVFCQSVKDLKIWRNLKIYQTPRNYKEFLNLLTSFTKKHSHFLKKMRKVVFGFAGMFDNKKEKLIYSPNLKDFENRNLKKDLEKILNTEIILENDAFLAGIGEANFGTGKKFNVFGYLTLSTGIGGAKIVSSQFGSLDAPVWQSIVSLVSSPEATQPGLGFRQSSRRNEPRETSTTNLARRNCEHSVGMNVERQNNVRIGSRDSSHKFATNENAFASEPGHSFLLMNNFLFEAEELLGGESIKKFFGKKPEEIKDKKFWNYYHQILSTFLINVSIFWSVDKIILGGGITKSLDFKKLNFLVNKLHPLPVKIKIIKGKLGELGVLYGGLSMISDK